MEPDNHLQEQKYIRAKKRVEDLKGYYWHLAIYVLVNLFLTGSQIIDGITEDKTLNEIFSDFGLYGVWVLWGIGLAIHTCKVFLFPFFMGNDWEERKIKEYMNNQRDY